MSTTDPLDSPTSGDAPEPEPLETDAMKGGDIKSVGDLIAFAYANGGKRFNVPMNVLEVIGARREPEELGDDTDPCLAQILQLSAADSLLTVPPRLLIAAEDGGAAAPLRRRLATLVFDVLRRHAVFQRDEVRSALFSPPSRTETSFDFLKSAVATVSAEELGFERRDLKPSDRDKLLANAVTTLALVLAIRDRWTIEELVLRLDAGLWQDVRAKGGARNPRALVADSRTPDALAVVAGVFKAQVRRAEVRAEQLETYSAEASQRAFEAERQAETRDREVERQASEIKGLEHRIDDCAKALDRERRSRVVDRSHHIDDYEILRTRILRMLSRQTDLLSDALHALRHHSTNVTDEYLERAIDAFTKELAQLKADEGGA